MIPEIFRISFGDAFSIPIYSFGLMMLLCFVGAMQLLEKNLEEEGFDPNLAEPMITHAAIGGILGARLSSIFSNYDALLADPIGVIFSSAGFVYYGGFIGGVFAVWIFLRKSNLSFMQLTNLVAAPLSFGYAIGRVGCQLSGDGDYGIESNLPWAMNYALGVIPTLSNVHPTPVYESIFAIMLVLILRSKKIRNILSQQGQLFGLYIVASSVFRFFVENLRIEPKVLGDYSQAQIVSFPLFIIGILLILNIQKKISKES